VTEIKNRQEHPGPGVNYSEIYIPDDQDLGTGQYTAAFHPETVAKGEPVMSWAVNPPVFQISLSLDTNTKEISVLLGKADGSSPESRRVFILPENVDLADTCTAETHFKEWQVERLALNASDCTSKYDIEI